MQLSRMGEHDRQPLAHCQALLPLVRSVVLQPHEALTAPPRLAVGGDWYVYVAVRVVRVADVAVGGLAVWLWVCVDCGVCVGWLYCRPEALAWP